MDAMHFAAIRYTDAAALARCAGCNCRHDGNRRDGACDDCGVAIDRVRDEEHPMTCDCADCRVWAKFLG